MVGQQSLLRGRPVGAAGVDQGGDDLQERQVPQRAVGQVDAVPDQHPATAPAGPFGELGQQPGLADPGVAGQHRQARPGVLRGSVQTGQGGQPVQLPGASDQRCHAPIMTTRR